VGRTSEPPAWGRLWRGQRPSQEPSRPGSLSGRAARSYGRMSPPLPRLGRSSLGCPRFRTCPSAAARLPSRGVAHDPDEGDAVRSPEACPVVAAQAPGRGPRQLNVRTPGPSSGRCGSAWTPRSRGSARSARCAAHALVWIAWSSGPHFAAATRGRAARGSLRLPAGRWRNRDATQGRQALRCGDSGANGSPGHRAGTHSGSADVIGRPQRRNHLSRHPRCKHVRRARSWRGAGWRPERWWAAECPK